jgi:hypothetical protein
MEREWHGIKAPVRAIRLEVEILVLELFVELLLYYMVRVSEACKLLTLVETVVKDVQVVSVRG